MPAGQGSAPGGDDLQGLRQFHVGPWLRDWDNMGSVSWVAFLLLEAFGSVYLDAGSPPIFFFPFSHMFTALF